MTLPPTAENPTRRAAVQAGVDLAALPEHVAVIMDGNGRWAQRRGLQRLFGHQEGYRTLRGILLASSELGIRYLTVYAFSAENWRRPEEEVTGLMKLIEQAARNELRIMHQNDVRVRVAGRMDQLPSGLQAALEEGIETTKDNSGITFTLAVNYGGRAEIVDAVKALIARGLRVQDIDEFAIAQHLYNPDIPDPDLMIRTAGEMRWSNFLIWQAAYAELVVLPEPWPEFGTEALLRAIAEYQSRIRKYGGL